MLNSFEAALFAKREADREVELQAKIDKLHAQLDKTPRGSHDEWAIETDLDHYSQRLANIQAGYGDCARLTGAKIQR